uniref:Tubulin/FtsZ GTPase domain-containing protein n=1 Tax=Ailuropoda melanoleuca TaxID=9646 RepID=A0A7N5KDI8_AILME
MFAVHTTQSMSMVVVLVGQCGNRMGCCFWDLALREHAEANQKGIYNKAINSFFRNDDTRVSLVISSARVF